MSYQFSIHRFLGISLCFGVLLTSCASTGVAQPTDVSNGINLTPTFVGDNGVGQQSSSVINAYGCFRPYLDTSIWNTPIDWSIARIHPDSNKMIDAFFETYDWVGSDPTKYAPNVYYVNNNTPLVSVTLRSGRSFRYVMSDIDIQYGQSGGTVFLPIPSGARPARGTDGELAIINLETGDEWGIINGVIDMDGRWLAGGAYRYNIHFSGIPPKGFAQRGAGIGAFVGIVRPCEIDRGYIGHAVTIAYDYPCAADVCQFNNWPAVIPPFTKTDGKGVSRYDIPEGSRLVIKPDVSSDKIIKACLGVKGCILWVLNMQEFGGFIVDNSGHPKTYAEGDTTAEWDPAIWSKDMLRNIPTDWYQALDWNYPSAVTP